MLYEYAQLRGNHKSLERYRYAVDSPPPVPFTRIYTDQIDGRYERMDKADQDKASGTSPRKRQRNTEPMSVICGTRCIPKLPSGAGSTTGNTETGI